MCRTGVGGLQCDECRPDHYNFTSSGCTPCNCFPLGSVRDDDVCDSVSGDCECVEGVTGRRCDTCPASSIGPNKNTVLLCVDCFCNGYSRQCTSDEGWYQAEVVAAFSDGLVGGFRSNGEIISSQLVLFLCVLVDLQY